jgi:hypothetical protein
MLTAVLKAVKMLLSCCPKKQPRCCCPNCSKSGPRCCPNCSKSSLRCWEKTTPTKTKYKDLFPSESFHQAGGAHVVSLCCKQIARSCQFTMPWRGGGRDGKIGEAVNKQDEAGDVKDETHSWSGFKLHVSSQIEVRSLNVNFKIFTKVITNRISVVAEKVIRLSQNGFYSWHIFWK